MKNKLIHFAWVIGAILLTQCSEPDNLIYTVLDDHETGAILRTIEISSAEFNSFDTATFFEVTIEEQDKEKGDLLDRVNVYLSFDDNTSSNGTTSKSEMMFSTIEAATFTNGDFNLPRTTIRVTLAQALSALSIDDSEFTGGDAIDIRLELVLTNGKTYSEDDSTGSLQGSYFASPYTYKSVIKCIPLDAVPGIYNFRLTDSYGDGWQGSHVKVTVDGAVTYYGVPSIYSADATRNSILEPYAGSDSSGISELTIPSGAQNMTFEWISGDFPSECSYIITYTALDGTNEQVAISESGPAVGEKILSICQ